MRVSLTGNTACYEYYTIGCLDIETHGDKQTTDEARDGIYDRVGMWCGYFITEFHDEDFKDRKYWAHNPEEMIKLIDDKCKEVGNLLIYVYNLPFDISYLITEIIKKYGIDNLSICAKSKLKTIYSITINTGYYNKHKHSGEHKIKFVDLSLLLGGGTLKKQCDSFQVVHSKEEFDKYDLNRHIGKTWEPTDEELEYNYYDVASMLEIIEKYHKLMENGNKSADLYYYGHYWFNSCSAASYAIKLAVSSSFGHRAEDNILYVVDDVNKKGEILHKAGTVKYKKGEYLPGSNKEFRKKYPRLKDEAEKQLLRDSYCGGLCYPFYDYSNKVIFDKVGHIDAASMYPSRIILEKLPYGVGRKVNATQEQIEKFCSNGINNKLHLIEIEYSYNLKANEHIDAILDIKTTHVKNIWTEGEQIFRAVIWAEITLMDMKEAYKNFNYKILNCYEYDCDYTPFKDFFLSEFNKKKNSVNKTERNRHKLIINSTYGKFGEKEHKREYYLKKCVDESGIEYYDTDVIKLEDAKDAKYEYVPLASSITAYARHNLYSMAKYMNIRNIVYCDTDSLFFIINDESLAGYKKMKENNLIGKDVGQWEFDGYYLGFKAIALKNIVDYLLLVMNQIMNIQMKILIKQKKILSLREAKLKICS